MVAQELTMYSTVEDIQQILNINEDQFKDYCEKIPVKPRKDLKTGKAVFSKEDVNLLVKAQKWYNQGESLDNIADKLKKPKLLTTNLASKNDIAVVIESIAESRDTLLADINKVLDEKLEGMDEIVVELIKCKGEAETLKQKLKQVTDENELLRAELSRYKPLKFGLYRKIL